MRTNTMRYLLLATMLLTLGCETKKVPAPTGTLTSIEAGAPAKKTYTREEFKALVIGKTKAELKSVLGNPADTVETQYSDAWIFHDITYLADSKNFDRTAEIKFKDGKAEAVSFF